jgi:hypothetical protein
MQAFTEGLLARATVLPGVRAAAVPGIIRSIGNTNSFAIVGRERSRGPFRVSVRRVTRILCDDAGALVRGRLLREADETRAVCSRGQRSGGGQVLRGAGSLGKQIRFGAAAAWSVSSATSGSTACRRSAAGGLHAARATPSADGSGVLLVRPTIRPRSARRSVR